MRAVVESYALVVSMLGAGCVERSDDWQDGIESSESSDGESSDGDGEHDPAPSCVGEAPIEDLPNALAWREVDDDGTPVLQVHIQSEPITCSQRDSSVSDGTQIRVTIPVALDPPTRLDLAEADGIALMSPYAPGNDGGIYTVAWLTGTIDVDGLEPGRITGGLHEAYGPFDGCFAAPICPD